LIYIKQIGTGKVVGVKAPRGVGTSRGVFPFIPNISVK
jgi:hypothetical protein